MPWFDETYFASMARHFSESGEFTAPVCPLMDYYYPQSKAYGPAYFLVLAGVIKVFGFGMLQIRLPSLLMGFGFILVAYRMLKENGSPAWLKNSFFLLLLLDPIFLQNIHSGRMDAMAIFCCGLGTLFLLRGFRENSKSNNYLAAGLFLGLAVLSTPRIAVNMAGAGLVAFLFFLTAPSLRSWGRLLSLAFVIFALYSAWIFWGFGGYSEAWNYFFGQPKEKLYYDNLAQGYISFKKYIPAFQFPALGLFLLLFFSWLYQRRPLPWLFWICFINAAAYYALVRDTGIYSIFSIPWIYLLLVLLAERLLQKPATELRLKTALWLLVLFNAGLFGMKQLVVILGSPARNDELAFQQFSALVPQGSRVVGDEAYYYTATRNGCNFQYLDRGASGFQRLKYHQEKFKFEYLIVRTPVSAPAEFNLYNKKLSLKKIGEISTPPESPLLKRFGTLLKYFGANVPGGYKGIIYRRR